jgi:amidase
LAELGNTKIKSLEDIIEFNKENTGTEGANAGDHPAFPTGQVMSSQYTRGCPDLTYLGHI